jgi:hypothetical protein
MAAPQAVADYLTDNPGGAFRGKTKDGSDLFVWNQYLPDTMDPRGPKR